MKKKLTTWVTSLMAIVMSLGITVPLAACNPDDGDSAPYKLYVCTMGDNPLSGVSVAAKSGGETVATAVSGSDGRFNFGNLSGTYTLQFSNLPVGYYPSDESYIFNSATADGDMRYRMLSNVIKTENEIPANKIYAVGDLMYDFELPTTEDGVYYKLSDVLDPENPDSKKAVFLNFWYSGCSWCQQEFPAMDAAYTSYSDVVSVFAVCNPLVTNDDMNDVKAWKGQYHSSDKLQIEFDMGLDSTNLSENLCRHFAVENYPTTVVIDRYGTIVDIHVGADVEQENWETVFAHYSSDDYTQSVTPGEGGEIEEFTPTVPTVTMPAADKMKSAVNAQDTDWMFEADTSTYAWPWTISSDNRSIYPSNTGERYSYAILYISNIKIEEREQAFAFDYVSSTEKDADILHVVIDGMDGFGKTSEMISGISADTKTCYVPLEVGTHDISLVYMKDNVTNIGEDAVYISNMRLAETSDIDYSLDLGRFAAYGEQDVDTLEYSNHVEVYEGADSYYRVKLGATQNEETDPLLLADIQNGTPFNPKGDGSIYDQYIAKNACNFNGQDYYNKLVYYNSIAGNSQIAGMITVTDEIKEILEAIVIQETGKGEAGDTWLDFCTYFVHYGPGTAPGNPVLGLSTPTAYKLTQADVDKDITVNVDRLLIPRGIYYSFTPTQSGAYRIRSVETGLSEVERLVAWLRSADNPENPDSTILDYSGEDQMMRSTGEEIPDIYNFHLYQYMEAGQTYYFSVTFGDSGQTGQFKFRIERMGDDAKIPFAGSAGYFTSTPDGSQAILPDTVDVKTGSDGFIYVNRPDAEEKGLAVYCDMVCVTRFINYPFENLIAAIESNPDSPNKDFFVLPDIDAAPGATDIQNINYFNDFKAYYEQSVAVDESDELYGLAKVDEKLMKLLKAICVKHDVGFNVGTEWLGFCYYMRYIGPSA